MPFLKHINLHIKSSQNVYMQDRFHHDHYLHKHNPQLLFNSGIAFPIAMEKGAS